MANRYWIGGAGNWNDAAHWSATSGGTGGASAPTAADNVAFDVNSGTGTVTVNAVANMLDLTFTAINAITLANAAYSFNVYGSLTLHSNLTVNFTGTGYLYMKATDARTIATNGKVANWNRLYFDGVGGTWTLQDNLSVGYNPIDFVNGTFDTNSKDLDAGQIHLTDAKFSKLYFRNSNIYTSFLYTDTANANNILDYGTSTVCINKSGVNCFYAQLTLNNVIIIDTFSRILSWDTLTINNLTIVGSAGNSSLIQIKAAVTVNNSFSINGNNASNFRLLLNNDTIGTARTITCNGTVTASNVDFRDIVLAGTCNKDLSAIPGGSGDCGGNSGIIFTPAQTQYFKHTSGAVNWSDTTKWFSNQAKTVQGRMPLPQDDAVFDAGSFTGASTMSINVPRIGRNKDFSAINQAVGIVLQNAVQTYGGWRFSLLNTISGNYLIQFDGHGRIFSEKVYLGVMSYFANNLDILGNNTFSEIVINAGCKIRITSGTTQSINKLTAIGTPAAPITIGSTTPGQRHTLNYTGNEASTVEYCNISDSKVTEARRLLAKNSVNAGNNQNWGFDILPALALNKKQVDKIYVGDKLVTAIYKGTTKIY